jgi:O-antigen/teichoic acid export membrane protein
VAATTTVRVGLQRARAVTRSRVVGQTVLFAGSSALGNAFSAVSKALLARAMSVASFGTFSFVLSFLQFAAMFFEFGLFQPAARLAALAREQDRRAIIGAALSLFVPVAALFAALMFGVSFVVDSVFNVHASSALRDTAPLAFVFAFPFVALALLQGVGRVHLQPVSNVLAQALFAVSLAIVLAASWHLSVVSAMLLRCATLGVSMVAIVVWLRPTFVGVGRHTRSLLAQARAYGFEIYVGRVLSIGTYNMDVLMLAALTNAKSVGYYTLAGAVAAGLGLPITSFATVLFPRMVRTDRIDTRWLTIAWAIGGIAVLGALLLGGAVIRLVFPRYGPAASLLVPLMMAEAVRDVTGIYNWFLTAHARGRELRNAGLVLTISNLILNFALIPPFGAMGAAWASFAALLANLAAHIVGYRRLLVSAPTAAT